MFIGFYCKNNFDVGIKSLNLIFAEEMLSNLRARLNNAKDEEIQNAASEQNKIIKLRLEKLFLNN